MGLLGTLVHWFCEGVFDLMAFMDDILGLQGLIFR